jgi:cytochrome c biogenesis protein CcdA
MVIMGVNMLGLFPALRKLRLCMPGALAGKIGACQDGVGRLVRNGPLMVGLLNGLMPCGPLQSMQIVALASGNPFAGALSMFLFSLGTVPLMLGLGSLVSALGRKFTKWVMTVGAILVVVLGLALLSQGGSLSGVLQPNRLIIIILGLCAVGIVSAIPFRRVGNRAVLATATLVLAAVAIFAWNPGADANTKVEEGGSVQIVDGKQVVKSTLAPGRYPNITVAVGTPVKWTIYAPEGSINGCNGSIIIPEYGIDHYAFQTGDNVIEFMPGETGRFTYSCWMGMIRGSITVAEDVVAEAGDSPAAREKRSI